MRKLAVCLIVLHPFAKAAGGVVDYALLRIPEVIAMARDVARKPIDTGNTTGSTLCGELPVAP